MGTADERDFDLLPAQMRDLAPLIERYGESDDVERSELLERASTDELRALAAAAEPHWDEINSFLGENMGEVGAKQDLAIAVDAFAQAAMEARIELEQRDAR